MLLLLAIILLILDIPFVVLILNIYRKLIKDIQGTTLKPKLLGAIIAYSIMPIALYYLIVKPKRNYTDAFLLGVVIYAVYGATNYALFDKWNIYLVIGESLWGGILFTLSYYLYNIIH